MTDRGGFLPFFLVFMVFVTPLFSGGQTGYSMDAGLEEAEALIEEGRLDEAIAILVRIARNDPDQIERVQKLIVEITGVEYEITALFAQLQRVLDDDNLSSAEKLTQTEGIIREIRKLDTDPDSDTWRNVSFVESTLRASLDILRRIEFFDAGNAELAQNRYREAVAEYRKGFIDPVFGEQQTYELFRDVQSPDDVGPFTAERQKQIYDAYKLYAYDGDEIISRINKLLDEWRQNSGEMEALYEETRLSVANSNPTAWNRELAGWFKLAADTDAGLHEVRKASQELDELRLLLYESLYNSPEEFRYDRINTFLNGRAPGEGILYAAETEWEQFYIGILEAMTERALVPYQQGLEQYRQSVWSYARASFRLTQTILGSAQDYIDLAKVHQEMQNNRDGTENPENVNNATGMPNVPASLNRFDTLLLYVTMLGEAAGIRSELTSLTEFQAADSNITLSASSDFPRIAAEVQQSINLAETLLDNWKQYGRYSGNPAVSQMYQNVFNDIESVLDALYQYRIQVYLQYVEPRYNAMESDTRAWLQISPGRLEQARELVSGGRPLTAMNTFIEPAMESLDSLAVGEFIDAVSDVINSLDDPEILRDFREFQAKAEQLLVLVVQDREEWQALMDTAQARLEAALKAGSSATASLNEAESLIQEARDTYDPDNMSRSYRARDLYTSAAAALDRASAQLIEAESGDSEGELTILIRERLAELEAETFSAPRDLARTIRDNSLEEADQVFNERLYDEGRNLLEQAQEFWVSVFGEEDVRLRERIIRFRIAAQSAQNTALRPVDPLYVEMNQYLNLANRYYREGLSLVTSSNNADPDAVRAFSAAEDLIQQVLNVFPNNADALLLKMKILQVSEPARYSRTVRELIRDADIAMRRNNLSALQGTSSEQGLDPQLQAIQSFDSAFPGLGAINGRLDIFLGRVIPPPDPADIRRSVNLTAGVRSDWEQTRTLSADIVFAASGDLIRRLDQALLLWEGNSEAVVLQDEIRFFTEPPPLDSNLRRLINLAQESILQNSRSTVEAVYTSIGESYPGFLNHPDVLKIKNWLGD